MRMEWNKAGERFFETGVDRGVLYPRLGPGVPWNGLVSVSENTSGGEMESLYFDGVKWRDLTANEEFQATLEAYSSPSEFSACDGQKTLAPGLYATQQPRETFGLSYCTLIGNDLVGTEYGYKIHVVYNCTAAPSGRSNKTVAANANPDTRSWTLETVPVPTNAYRPTAHLAVDTSKITPARIAALEAVLYGDETNDPRLPLPPEIITILTA